MASIASAIRGFIANGHVMAPITERVRMSSYPALHVCYNY